MSTVASGRRSRPSLLAEAVVLTLAAVLTVVWVIPAQTTDGGFGLSPAFLPTACAIAIGGLVAADGLLRLVRREAVTAYSAPWTACMRIGGAASLGVIGQALGGVGIAAAVTVACGMLALDERRPVPILLASAISGGLFWLIFG